MGNGEEGKTKTKKQKGKNQKWPRDALLSVPLEWMKDEEKDAEEVETEEKGAKEVKTEEKGERKTQKGMKEALQGAFLTLLPRFSFSGLNSLWQTAAKNVKTKS